MNIHDEYLKAAYRSYLDGLRRGSRMDCPSTADLIRFFSAGPPRRFKARVLDHVAGCGFCADEFEILMDMDRDARAFSTEVERLRKAEKPDERIRSNLGFIILGRWLFAGVGLAFVLAGILTLATRRIKPPFDADPYRSADSPALILECPLGPVNGHSTLVFRWSSPDRKPGDAYVVDLFDDSLRQFWISPPVEDSYLILPEEVQKTLVSHRRYFWMIESRSGSSSTESDLELFTVEKRNPGP